MRASELAMTLADMQKQIDDVIVATKVILINQFVSDTEDNEKSVDEAVMHGMMVDHVIYSGLASKYKKTIDRIKVELDNSVEALGNSPLAVAGSTVILHENNVFRFSKKQNNNGTTTSITDLVTQLARHGVDKAEVDAAHKAATKEKKGNTYYEVTVVD